MYNGLFEQRKFIKLNIIIAANFNREHINENFINNSMLKGIDI